jgi:outer membrane protein OmpA-like peptidoglycan-associated protein
VTNAISRHRAGAESAAGNGRLWGVFEMRIVLARACVLAAVGLAAAGQAGAYGQEVGPALSADELTRMLAPAPAAARGGAAYGLRGLRPGGGGGITNAAATAALPAGAEGSGVVPDLRLLFPYDSAELTPATKARLDQLGRALKGRRSRATASRSRGTPTRPGTTATTWRCRGSGRRRWRATSGGRTG